MKKNLSRGLATIVCLACLFVATNLSAQNAAIHFVPYKYINVPNGGASSALNFTSGSFTLEAWIKADNFFGGNNTNTIMGNDSSWLGVNTYSGYALRTNAGKLSFYYCYGAGVREVITSTQVFDTAMWQHVAVTKQGGDITLYVNGQVVASGSFTTNNTIQPSTKTFKIGENGSADYKNFLGDIDEVKVWNVARTQTQVRADMEELCGTIPSNLIAYYRLNDVGTGSTNPIVCASNSTLNGVFNGPITSHPGAVFFNGGITTLYVDSSSTATGCAAVDGSSWAKAFPDLNTAIEIAQTHPQITQILVAKGTYYPTNFGYDLKIFGKGSQLKSNTNKDKTFQLRPGVDLFGGYPSGGGLTASPSIYRTILDGARAGGVVTDTATIVVKLYNPFNVPDTTKLVGVTVRNAVGFNGRGVHCSGSYGGAAMVQNCIIRNNGSTTGAAVGMHISITSVLAQNDTIINNQGGGVSSDGSSLRLYDSYINNNIGTGIYVDGGTTDIRGNEIAYSTVQAYYQHSGSATIVGNNIHHNGIGGIEFMLCQSTRVDSNIISYHDSGPISTFGSAVYLYGDGPHLVRYNTISNNAAAYGAGIFSFNAINTITGNIVENNHAYIQGGAMWLQGASTQVFGNIVRQNSSENNAGGILIDNGMGGIIANVANNVIVGNTAQTNSGGISVSAQKFTFVNNVIANNVGASDAGAQLYSSIDSISTAINNTFYNNTATDLNFSPNTGGLHLTNSNRQIKAYHNIFWKNKIGTSATVAGADYISGGSGKHLFINNVMQLAASNYTTGTSGSADIGTYASGNFFAVNPQFANESNIAGTDGILATADDGLQLLNTSPFIGAGKNSLFPFTLTTIDAKKDARVIGDSIDLGAYELGCLPVNASSQSLSHVCKGSGTTLRASSSAAYPNVLWYADSTSTGLLDTGYFYTTQPLTATDTFWVTVSGCAGGKRVPVVVTAHDLTSDTAKVNDCDSFYWAPTNTFYKAGGFYSKKYTSVWGCDSMKVLDLTINHSIVMPTQTVAACDSFLWDATNLYYNVGGSYSVTLATVNGCDSALTLNLSVTAVRASVSLNYVTKTELEEVKANADFYQWLKCDPYQLIPGATSSSYTFPASGRYAVIATKGGCTDTSNCIPVIHLGIEDITAPLAVKPNPTSGMATVTLPAAFSQGKLHITNALGQTVVNAELKTGNNINIDLDKYPNGLYHISIWADDKYYTATLQKEQ